MAPHQTTVGAVMKDPRIQTVIRLFQLAQIKRCEEPQRCPKHRCNAYYDAATGARGCDYHNTHWPCAYHECLNDGPRDSYGLCPTHSIEKNRS